MKKTYKNLGLTFSLIAASFYGCSQEDVMTVESQAPLNEPCRITVDLTGGGDSRLALEKDGTNLKSTWSAGDQFEVYKNGICYTFTLDDECAGSSVGTFTSPTTPPINTGEISQEWYNDNFYYNVYYPSKSDYENISFENQIQNGDGNMEHLKDKITMKHYVAHYTDIRFVHTDYQSAVTFPGWFSPYTIGTPGANFYKNMILRIDASNLPVDFQPVSLQLESFHEYSNIIVPFLTHNAQTEYTTNDNKMSMTLDGFDKDKDFVAYMATSVYDKTFVEGSVIRLTIKDATGETYYADKVFDNEKIVKGGKMLTFKYNSGWKKGNNSSYHSSDNRMDGKTEILQTHTEGKGIKVVFMGDGFSDRQIADGTYKTVMMRGMEAFFAEQPFKDYKNYFDVDIVYAVSTQEGCKDDATQANKNNTAFSTWFGEGTYIDGNKEKCITYAKKVTGVTDDNIKNTLIVVMMNSAQHAGTCHMSRTEYDDPDDPRKTDYGEGVSVAFFPIGTTDAALRRVLNHEANGHGFAKLDDEYYYNKYIDEAGGLNTLYQEHKNHNSYGWYLNVSITSDPAAVYWADFINDDTYDSEEIGVYEGAHTYCKYWWRPTYNSIMRENTGGFNAPSRKIIYYRINKLANGDTWTYNHNTFKELDKNWKPVSTMSARSSRSVNEEFIPLARPVVTIVDEFGNVIRTER